MESWEDMLNLNSVVLREGLNIQLVALEETWSAEIGAPEITLACAFCYQLRNDCSCDIPNLWPLPVVLQRLKHELALLGGNGESEK